MFLPLPPWTSPGAAQFGGCLLKRFGKCLALFYLFAVLLCTAASANSAAPDYRVAVKVAHAPDELYYLDLLEESDGEADIFERDGLDYELLEALKNAAPDGWLPCSMSTSLWEKNFSGDIAGNNGMHVFHGYYTPKIFRILIVTKSGESWVSEPLKTKMINSTVRVDWIKKTAVMPPVQILYILQFLSTLLPTLLIEGLIFFAFRFPGKRNWLVFLLVNLVTQGALSFVLCVNVVGSNGNYIFLGMLLLIPVELLIAFVEAVLYMALLRGQPEHERFFYGIAANAASFLLGLFTVGPFYVGIVELIERIFLA